jgi:outer membrane protein assembly factor BamB
MELFAELAFRPAQAHDNAIRRRPVPRRLGVGHANKGLLGMLGAALAAALLFASAPSRGQSVLTYHGDDGRSGDYVVAGLTWARARTLHLDAAFRPRFSGHVYAQPLYWRPPGASSGLVVVATESDTVAAFDADTGRTVWQRSLGRPVPLAALPCGNIDPLGITGTPVIDAARQALYLDAAVADAAGMRHRVFALSLRDGATLPGWPIDIADTGTAQRLGFAPRVQNQRGALVLLDGAVYVPFGGHFGDCGDYHGWIIGLRLAQAQPAMAWRTRARGGGVWTPGGVAALDGALWFATGNTIGATRWSDGEGVFRLAADLRHTNAPADFFTPADWRELDERDADLGGANPIPLDVPKGGGGVQRLILALGKDGRGYLLDRGDLGGVGGGRFTARVAHGPIITAPATFASADGAFVIVRARAAVCPPGESGDLVALKVVAGSPPRMSPAWCAAFDGAGIPIVTTSTRAGAEPIVWVLGAEGDGRLHGFRGDTGAPLIASKRLAGLRHFQTLIAADGKLYAAVDDRVYAFAFGP